ncbi:MAG: DUF427 domain-containing protein [Trueperaceae bacterium]
MAKAIFDGVILAESNDTELVEGNIYFPRDSVNMDLFSHSPTPYTCPWKGVAEYFNANVNGQDITDIAWSYPNPKEAAKTIAGHLAFDKRKGVEVIA